MKHLLHLTAIFYFGFLSFSLGQDQTKFKQLEELLPTANAYRTASGAPGHEYWQQRADYDIEVELDEPNRAISGKEKVTYFNNSPDVLTYIWVQLEQNKLDKNSNGSLKNNWQVSSSMSFYQIERHFDEFVGGYKINMVQDEFGKDLKYTINQTMMRIDLNKPLKNGESVTFNIKWQYNINDARKIFERTGYEYFDKDDNCIFELAHWFPRMAVYHDAKGWQNKQFLGSGEFALAFGNYKVSITVPADHIVASTGELQNPNNVISTEQKDRLKKAETSNEPVEIVTQEEATKAEKSKSKEKKTWVFYAKNVRDFAWASSRKFIWDAMRVDINGNKVWAMSYYPKEGNPLWGQYSTRAVAHTLKVYSKYTVNYSYPVAISVNGPIGGMEYPMISFNGARPESDGTYSESRKYSLISVIIHEVGHNFFPMIINSDERQWTWMDEGLNTFCQFLAEQEWDINYPSRRGPARYITDYMNSGKENMVPIMTNSESLLQFGNNAYGKPATALNILRETVMGRELFDYAFKEYATRWAFKHPEPADFFRTMEDASGVDLDWFWRGWFYTTDHVDISLDEVSWFTINTQNMEIEKPMAQKEKENEPMDISDFRNKQEGIKTVVEIDLKALDFYNTYSQYEVTESEKAKYKDYYEKLDDNQKKILKSGLNFYKLKISNKGGLVMPVIIQLDYEDGTTEIQRLPAEIWLRNEQGFTRTIITQKKVKQFTIDPYLETADCDLSNNNFPQKYIPSKVELYKQEGGRRGGSREQSNPMRESQKK